MEEKLLCVNNSALLFDQFAILQSTLWLRWTPLGPGALNDSFLQNICSEKQKLPRIFYALRKAKNF